MTSQQNTTLKSIVKEAEKACSNGSYLQAEKLYTRGIEVESSNPILYGNRSAARVKLKMFNEALSDAQTAISIDSNYAMGYFRQGVTLQCLGDFAKSIVSFSDGIVRDQKSIQFVIAMVDVAMKSSLQNSLEPVMNQLTTMHLEQNSFIVTSVIGQELLSHNYTADAVKVLENAVAIGTKSLKLRGSVYSALSSALWSLGSIERAIHYMQEDLNVSRLLTDNVGECRAHGNLGAAYFTEGKYQLAKESHNRQLALAQGLQDQKTMASAFSSLGHIHAVMDDLKMAAESHKQSSSIFRNIRDITGWCRELAHVGEAYLALGDLDSALQWQLERLRVSSDEFDSGSQDGAKEEARVRLDLGTIYHKLQKFAEEITCLQKSADISNSMNDRKTEAQAVASLGYMARQIGDFHRAQSAYERLLELALTGSDRSLEAKACANLGVIHHQLGDFEMALKLQARNLELSQEFRDLGAQGRAHGNIGNAYSAMGLFSQAIQHHIKELEISSSTGDKASECSTHGNLAVAFQALNDNERAMKHFRSQIEIASEINDITNESRAYMNLANYHSSRKEYRKAIELYKNFLDLNENNDADISTGVARACYNLGFAFYSLRDFENAVTYYEQSLRISLETEDDIGAARAYCNLGLSLKSLGKYERSLQCQNSFLALSNRLQSARGVFKALGNIGDVCLTEKRTTEAISFYQQQLELARNNKDEVLLAQACSALGSAYKLSGDLQKSLEMYSEELRIYRAKKDHKNEFKAQGHLGSVLTLLGNFSGALECYESQTEVARNLADTSLESNALGNIGISLINTQRYEEAISYFERQLVILDKIHNSEIEKARVMGNIGDCHEVLEEFDEAVSIFQESLSLASGCNYTPGMERAYHGLSSVFKLMNKPKESIAYCRLRINACQLMHDVMLQAESYGELGYLYTLTTEYKNAIFCMKMQMKLADGYPQLKGDAACGLGSVYHIMKNYSRAIHFHKIDLQIAIDTENLPCQGRAHGNLGSVYESIHEHTMAITHQEQHLFIAESLKDSFAKLTSLRGIARNTLRLGSDHQRAALLLQQALLLAKELGAKDEQGKCLLDLGLTHWATGDLKNAEIQLLEAEEILINEFWKSGILADFVGVSVHPNSYIELFIEITTCRSSLTRLFATAGDHTRALQSAEKLRTLPDMVMKRKLEKRENEIGDSLTDDLVEYSAERGSVILYYSMIAGSLLTWVFTPEEGLCGFTEEPLYCQCDDESSEVRNMLSHLTSQVRDTLGVVSSAGDPEDQSSDGRESHSSRNDRESQSSRIGGKITESKESETGNKNNDLFQRLLNCMISSQNSKDLYSIGISEVKQLSGKKLPVFSLYDLLLGGVQEKMMKYVNRISKTKLVLVVEGELLLVPFSLLKKRAPESYLCQQFCLRTTTSARELLREGGSSEGTGFMTVPDRYTRAVVVGNPMVSEILDRSSSQASEEEANLVGSLLKVEPIVGKFATKENVDKRLQHCECLHLACDHSMEPTFKIYFSDDEDFVPEKFLSVASNADSGIGREIREGRDPKEGRYIDDSPNDIEDAGSRKLSDDEINHRSLALGELLTYNLSALKLLVLGSTHSQNSNTKLESLMTLVQTVMMTGVHALLLPLWPVPETVSRVMMQSFYSRIINGITPSEALNESMDILRTSEQFEHPSYWAGFVLIGQDLTLEPRNLALIHALALLVKSDPGHFHDTVRLVLHLIDKSLDRINTSTNESVPMYTAQASISKKVQNVTGWRQLFSALGFELRQSMNGLPDAVFFPQFSMKEDLENAKPDLISLLQLSVPILTGLGRLFTSPYTASSLTIALVNCMSEYNENPDADSDYVTVTIGRKTWQTDGCDDLLSSLGFNVSQVGEENVLLHCTSSCLKELEGVLRPMKMFFGDKETFPPESEEEDVREEDENQDYPDQTPRGSKLANLITRGLPQSSRRSIAVDPNHKSPSSSDTSQRMELPDHMMKPLDGVAEHSSEPIDFTEPQKFTLKPSSGHLVIPKPIFPRAGRVPGVTESSVPKYPSSGISSFQGVSKGQCVKGHGSSNDLPEKSNGKNSESTDISRSPMFYRQLQDVSSTPGGAEILPSRTSIPPEYRLPGNLQTRTSYLGGENLDKQISLSLLHKSSGGNENLGYRTSLLPHPQTPPRAGNLHPLSDPLSSPISKVVYPSPQKLMTYPEMFGSQDSIYNRLKQTFVPQGGRISKTNDPPTYTPGPSVAKSVSSRANPNDYRCIVDKLTKLTTDDAQTNIELANADTQGSHEFKGQQQNTGVIQNHKPHGVTQPPPPYKFSEIVTSPRRSSHSRESSHASQGSTSSNKSAKRQRRQMYRQTSNENIGTTNSKLNNESSNMQDSVTPNMATANQFKPIFHINQHNTSQTDPHFMPIQAPTANPSPRYGSVVYQVKKSGIVLKSPRNEDEDIQFV